MPNLIHVAEYLGGGLGLILLGWVLRWGQHRDDCRANLEDEGRYQYDRGWDDNQRRHDDWHHKSLREIAADLGHTVINGEVEDMAGPTLLTDTQQLPGQQTMSDEEYEVYAQSHVISQELAALAAEDLGQPHGRMAGGSAEQDAPTSREGIGADEPLSLAAGHLESTQEWQARMDLEAAQWCARHGLRHESAWAA